MYRRLLHEMMHKQMIQTLRKLNYGRSHMQMRMLCKNFSSQRTCVSNSTALMLTQLFRSYGRMCLIALTSIPRKYNNLAVYHGALLVTMGGFYKTKVKFTTCDDL